jgi:sugar transferase (PEP-CTERM/EpsH1 system associated)
MAKVLLLVHRLPYPPNKGDKVRSFHLLKHLAARHQVYLGTFIDDPEDEAHVETVRAWCAGLHIARLAPRQAKVRSLAGLVHGRALTLDYYRDAGLHDWVAAVCRDERPDSAVVFSSAMAQYIDRQPNLPALIDFVDVDSAKWSGYARMRNWPMSWIFHREGRCLLAYERQVARRALRSFFVTEKEADLFRRAAPESAARVDAMQNGVDAAYFSPEHALASPFEAGTRALVFTGAMDYWPNEDAVAWFAQEMFPRLAARQPDLRFYIVGRSPTPAVRALAGERVVVTGTVPDVRPYLKHAAAVVAPLRLARGIQNKILEAMAMQKAVVAAGECVGAIEAVPGRDLEAAAGADAFVACVTALLADPARARSLGEAARRQVLAHYSWEAHLSRLDPFLEARAQPAPVLSGALA